jgi:hypothetical protein
MMRRARQVTILKVTAALAGAAMLAGVVLTWVSVANPGSEHLGSAGITVIIAFLIIALLCTSVIERWKRQGKQG